MLDNFLEACGFRNCKIIDGHAHLCHDKPLIETAEAFADILDYYNYDALNIASIPMSYSVTHNINTFYCKSVLSPKIYASAGLIYNRSCPDLSEDFLRQVKLYHKMGCDGIKMLDGKVTQYRKRGLTINGGYYDKFFEYAQENKLPVLIHIGDPLKFWNKETAGEYAIAHGWYVEPHEPTLEDLRKWISDTLEKFPDITMILAHFYFMSDELDRAAKMFDKYPNLYFDITPGGEMFVNFTANYDEAKEFFKKYKDRILYGTDLYNDFNKNSVPHHNVDHLHRIRVFQARAMMESNEEFLTPLSVNPLKPFGFDSDVTDCIYSKNFCRLYGNTPAPVDKGLVLEEAERILRDYSDLSQLEKDNLNVAIQYFKG
jgi:predicted TIM-barrel fold metal-dependent hydrolase